MLDHDLLASAYQVGQLFGAAVRWLLLLAVGFKLVQRLVRGSFGEGFRRARTTTVVGLAIVVAGLAASVRYDFAGGSPSAKRGSDLSAVRTNVVRGCMSQGQKLSVCACYGDEVLRRTGQSAERFTALERDIVARQKSGQPPPQLIIDAARFCVAREG